MALVVNRFLLLKVVILLGIKSWCTLFDFCRVIPQYLMYRPANAVPYATVEADLQGVYIKYCTMDPKGTLIMGAASELEQKSCAFQHWIHQWTHGNLLVTQLEGRGRTHTALWLTQPTRNTLLKCDFSLVYLFCRC